MKPISGLSMIVSVLSFTRSARAFSLQVHRRRPRLFGRDSLLLAYSSASNSEPEVVITPSTSGNNKSGQNATSVNQLNVETKNGSSPTLTATTTTTPSFDASSLLAVDPSHIHIQTVISQDNPVPASENVLQRLPFVKMFRGSANYIANHRNTVAVYHVPGSLLDLPDPAVFRDLMNDVALTWLLGMKIVLVVGSRHQIERRLRQEQYADASTSAHGLRVTDEKTLRIVKEEAGYVRFEVERQLARSLRMQGGGTLPNGGHGYYDGNVVSGNFYSAQPFGILDGVDFRFTGFVRRVEVEKIAQVHETRDICLLTTLGVSPSGEVFNVNSESLAACVAGSMQASKVIFFTDQEMELRHRVHGNKIQSLRLSDGRNLLSHYGITMHRKGYVTFDDQSPADMDRDTVEMLLRVGWSIHALEQGVKRAHIISPKHGALLQELYTRDGSGVLVSGDLYEGIRRASVHDVSGIHELITPLIRMGTLIDRPKATLEKDIDSYYVYTRDNHIVACGQMKFFEEGYAEIGCLVVSKDYRSRGRGDAMLGYLERLCHLNGCTTVFVLSTQTMEWFVERGFEPVAVEKLPPSRQASYNYKRASKIYMKHIESVRDLDASELWWS